MDPWIHKHIPQTSQAIVGQDEQVSKLQNYVDTYARQKKKGLLLHGPFGVGKTVSVHAVAKERGWDLIEINASDHRNKAAIHELVGNALGQYSLLGKQKIVLIDEIDGLSGTKDRGGIPELVRLIAKSTFPVVFTANDAFHKKLSGLRKKCELLAFHPLSYKAIAPVLTAIASKENVAYDEAAIQQLARESDGDLRAAINDLQVLSTDGQFTKKDIEKHFQRATKTPVQDALFTIFKTKQAVLALPALDHVDLPIDKLFLWLEENLPREYTYPEDCAKGFAQLSLADVYFGRIRRWQYYRFYVYIYNLFSAGIALAKREKYAGRVVYKENKRILKMWIVKQKHLKKKSIAEKWANKTHTSTKRALEAVVYSKQLFQNNPEQATALAEELDLSQDEVAWLKQ